MEFAVGWDTPITKWLAFNFEIGTTMYIGYSRYTEHKKILYGFEGLFHRGSRPASNGYVGTPQERIYESAIKSDSNRKGILQFRFGFKFLI